MNISAYRSGWYDQYDGYGIAGGTEKIMIAQRGAEYARAYMLGRQHQRQGKVIQY
jgi:hypothetical protein